MIVGRRGVGSKPVDARVLVNGGTAGKRWWDERSEGLEADTPPPNSL